MRSYKKVGQGNLVGIVFETLKQDIVNGVLKQKHRFPPQEVLAEQFGVSRTVIREAHKNWLRRAWW
jgi:DNA-binding FadR family transcriptional regulator